MFNYISNYDLSDLESDFSDEIVNDSTVETAIIVNNSVVIFASVLGYYSFPSDHMNFDQATSIALKYLDSGALPQAVWDSLEDLQSLITSLKKWSNGRLAIEGNRVRFDGDLLPTSLEDHLLTLFNTGKEYALSAWSKFAEKLRDASHTDTHNRLHAFLQYNDLAINEEGNVLAWKVVTPDFLDKHSRTFNNSVGEVVSMPRTKVTFDPTRTCSAGLHACAFEYLSAFGSSGDQVILVEIDVRDIVSVPIDYDGKKVRCCKYVVKHHAGTWGVNIDRDTNPREVLERFF